MMEWKSGGLIKIPTRDSTLIYRFYFEWHLMSSYTSKSAESSYDEL
jgi:hypothetical protein